MYGNEITMFDSAVITVFSMAVVFLVLLLISYMIDVLRPIINGKEKPVAPSVPKAAPEAPAVSASEAQKEKELHDAQVVLISAAIAAYLGKSPDTFVVKRISRVSDDDSEWAKSGRISCMR